MEMPEAVKEYVRQRFGDLPIAKMGCHQTHGKAGEKGWVAIQSSNGNPAQFLIFANEATAETAVSELRTEVKTLESVLDALDSKGIHYVTGPIGTKHIPGPTSFPMTWQAECQSTIVAANSGHVHDRMDQLC